MSTVIARVGPVMIPRGEPNRWAHSVTWSSSRSRSHDIPAWLHRVTCQQLVKVPTWSCSGVNVTVKKGCTRWRSVSLTLETSFDQFWSNSFRIQLLVHKTGHMKVTWWKRVITIFFVLFTEDDSGMRPPAQGTHQVKTLFRFQVLQPLLAFYPIVNSVVRFFILFKIECVAQLIQANVSTWASAHSPTTLSSKMKAPPCDKHWNDGMEVQTSQTTSASHGPTLLTVPNLIQTVIEVI